MNDRRHIVSKIERHTVSKITLIDKKPDYLSIFN